MQHCCSFDADDFWYLKSDDKFSNRTVYLGVCPICNKPVIELVQQNKFSRVYLNIRKSGKYANDFAIKLLPDRIYSKKHIFRKKIKNSPYRWRYGLNKTNKSGTHLQISADFFGNTELIKTL